MIVLMVLWTTEDVLGWRTSRNVIFRRTSEVVITRSKWLVTFVLDLNPYEQLLHKLGEEIAQLELAGDKALRKFTFHGSYQTLLYSHNQETSLLNLRYRMMKSYLKGLELLQGRRNRRELLPIVGKALGVLFGTATTGDLSRVRRKVKHLEQQQQNFAQIAKESLSIINVTRMDVAENRDSINKLIHAMYVLGQQLSAETQNITAEFEEFSEFTQTYLQLMIMTNKVRQTSQTLTTLLEHLKSQLDMLSLGHLAPSIVATGELKELLLNIQAELPHHLRLPVDPTEKLWRYYNSLGCVTILENNKLLVIMSIPLLDREGTFEVYQAINLPVPYPRFETGAGAVAKNRLESNYIALNMARTKFMLLTDEEAEKCKASALRTCTSASPVYVSSGHHLCILELFKGNKEDIDRVCQVEILTGMVLPQAVAISDGIWAVAVRREIGLSKVCEGKETKGITISPPLSIIKLSLGCSAFGETLSLPPFYQAEEEFEESKSLLDIVKASRSNWTQLWEPIVTKFPNITLDKMPEILEPLKRINMNQLAEELRNIQDKRMTWAEHPETLTGWASGGFLLLCIAVIMLSCWIVKKRKGRRVKVDLNPATLFGAASVGHEQFEEIPMVSVHAEREPPVGEGQEEPVAPGPTERRTTDRLPNPPHEERLDFRVT